MNAAVARLVKPQPSLVHLGLLLLRLGFGGAMCYGHGWAKLQNYGKAPSQFPMDPLGLGSSMSFYASVGAEFACALLVTIGLLTRVACAPLIFAMGVAFFVVHKGSLSFVPAEGASEPAALYLLAFAILMLCGPGKFSLDQAFFGAKGAKA